MQASLLLGPSGEVPTVRSLKPLDIIVTPPWSTIGSHNPFLNLSRQEDQQQVQQMLINVRDIFAEADWKKLGHRVL